MTEQFERGDQVAYIPIHADGDIEHPDVEFGFVTSQRGDTVFCRYWRKGQPGVLRTVANSQGTPVEMLVGAALVSPKDVFRALHWIDAQEMAMAGRYNKSAIEEK